MPEHANSPASSNYSQVHTFLKLVYENPENLEAWVNLAELFHVQGEKAQEHYCRFYIKMIQRYKRNGG